MFLIKSKTLEATGSDEGSKKFLSTPYGILDSCGSHYEIRTMYASHKSLRKCLTITCQYGDIQNSYRKQMELL